MKSQLSSRHCSKPFKTRSGAMSAPSTEGETPENPNSRKFKWVNLRRITIDLDLDPIIKNDAIVIDDDTDTDTDTTASGDTVVEVVDSPVRCIDVSGTAESESPIPWDGPWHHCSRYGYEVFGGDDSSEDL